MDIDTIKKDNTRFFQEGTVTIVGSGLSLVRRNSRNGRTRA